MKHLILLPAFLLLCHTIVFSQGCLPDGISFDHQYEIDNFQTDYPGCTEIEGQVIIFCWDSDILNLNGLSAITSIGGMLLINSCNISTLSGLDNLTSVGGALWLHYNSFTNIEALNNLASVGSLTIYHNDALYNLTGLENLTSIESYLKIYNNELLNDISALSFIENDTIVHLAIYENSALSNCDIQSICMYFLSPNGTEEIHDNASGCNSPEEVKAACLTSIEENPTIEGLSIFPNPATSFITINIKVDIPLEEAIIYNHLGQKALVAVPVNNTVDVSELKPGIYFIEVATKEWRGRTKLVIKN